MLKYQRQIIAIRRNAKSRNGCAYEAAGRHTTFNGCVRDFNSEPRGGRLSAMNCQIVEISEALGSVVELANAGGKVVFQKQESYIEAPDGNKTKFRRSKGRWCLDC